MAQRTYDLKDRLLAYAVEVVRVTRCMEKSMAAQDVAEQLLCSGTAAFPHHGEAQSAESPRDFIHKMKLALKELRETERWLLLVKEVPLTSDANQVTKLLQETDELIRIFVSSIQTSIRRQTSTDNRLKEDTPEHAIKL